MVSCVTSFPVYSFIDSFLLCTYCLFFIVCVIFYFTLLPAARRPMAAAPLLPKRQRYFFLHISLSCPGPAWPVIVELPSLLLPKASKTNWKRKGKEQRKLYQGNEIKESTFYGGPGPLSTPLLSFPSPSWVESLLCIPLLCPAGSRALPPSPSRPPET